MAKPSHTVVNAVVDTFNIVGDPSLTSRPGAGEGRIIRYSREQLVGQGQDST